MYKYHTCEHPKKETCSEWTVECYRVQISHVSTPKKKHTPNRLQSAIVYRYHTCRPQKRTMHRINCRVLTCTNITLANPKKETTRSIKVQTTKVQKCKERIEVRTTRGIELQTTRGVKVKTKEGRKGEEHKEAQTARVVKVQTRQVRKCEERIGAQTTTGMKVQTTSGMKCNPRQYRSTRNV